MSTKKFILERSLTVEKKKLLEEENNIKLSSPLIWIYLKKTFPGIGIPNSIKICSKFGISLTHRLSELHPSIRKNLNKFTKERFNKNPRLYRKSQLNSLVQQRDVRGFQFRNNLPINFQRTRNNAKTRKKRRVF